MTRFASLLLIAVCLVLSGCRDESRLGTIALAGRLFIFNPRMATATAVITVEVLEDLPEGARVALTFENPAGGKPLQAEKPVRAGQKRVDFETEPLFCIRKNRPYAFTLTLHDGSGTALQNIDSSLQSDLDQSVLPDAPLVEGPGYDPNPALKGNKAGSALRKHAANCPA